MVTLPLPGITPGGGGGAALRRAAGPLWEWTEPLLLLNALTVPRLHREGRVVRLVSDLILKVNRPIAGHSEGLGGTVEEREERGRERGGTRGPGGVHLGTQTMMCGVPHLLPRAVQGKVICLGTLQTLAMGKPCRGTISVCSSLQ